MLTFGGLVGAALVWIVLGRLPITVTGSGVLMRPRQVVDVQAPASGRLVTLAVHTGAVIKQGDVLGIIDQAEIRRKLEEERAKLAALQTQDQAKSLLQQQQAALQRQQIELDKAAIQLRHQDLQKRLQDAQESAPVFKLRVDNRKRLEVLGLTAKNNDELLQAQKVYLENQDKIATMQTELKQLASQMKQLDTKIKTLSFQELETSTARSNLMRELQSAIALDELQLEQHSRIISPYDGRVVELTVNPGQLIQQGARLAAIDREDATSKIVGLLYFPVKDGKKIHAGMRLQIVPDTVERERFGGILSTVTSVSAFAASKEGIASLIGNEEVVKRLLAQGPQIEVVATLEADPATFSGYKWSSSRGPELVISSGTTASGRVVVEQRAPLTYVLPSLREIAGL